MSESAKTFGFIAAAVGVVALALLTLPSSARLEPDELIGDTLYDFNPLNARRMQIDRYDFASGEAKTFEVAQVGNLWTIPSKEGYPADAEDQMVDAATALTGLKILRVASENPGQHRLYDVLDPTDEARRSGEEGVGIRVTVEDGTGENLADVIVGGEVKDAEGQRYVRQVGRDLVYVVDLEIEPFSTSFDDWIEKDLLKLSTFDVSQVRLNDYTFEIVPALQGNMLRYVPQWNRRADMTLAYDDSDAEWQPVELLKFDEQQGPNGEFVPTQLQEDEELNSQALNDLKNALDDLRIVDVQKKPADLIAALQAGTDGADLAQSQAAVDSLASRGFIPVQTSASAPPELLSSQGEVVCTLKNGVEYVLRFGDVLEDSQEGQDSTPEGETESESAQGLNRFIFVNVRFNEDAIEKPELADLPDLPQDEEEAEEEQPKADATEEGDTDTGDAEDDADGNGDADESADSEAEEAADAESDSADEDTENGDTESIVAERKRIEEENQRKLDEYADKIKEGQEKVQELNERFGDWYYVISDEVYQKMHLSYDDVVVKKEDEAEGDAAGANVGGFGAPGGGIPGLPNLPDLGIPAGSDAETTEVPDAGGSADETGLEESADTETEDQPADQESTEQGDGAGESESADEAANNAEPTQDSSDEESADTSEPEEE